MAQKDENEPHQEPITVTIEVTTALCTILETFSFSRALVGGVASIISLLIHTNDHLLEALGPNARKTPAHMDALYSNHISRMVC